MNSGDIAFIIFCAIAVFFMTPGVSMLYGGMVDKNNTVNVITSTFVCCGLGILLWFAFGYTLSFGPDYGGLGIIGNLDYAFFRGLSVSQAGPYSDSIPSALFALLQTMTAVITPAIIVGSVVGRMKFKPMVIFIIAWMFLVFFPLIHMVWADGGLMVKLNVVDYGGGTAVHMSSGISGLVACIMLGKRENLGKNAITPHNLPLYYIGGSIVYAGWFAFNGGTALGANGTAIHAIINTALSSSVGILTWLMIEAIVNKKVSLSGIMIGAIVGLVGITPGAGYVPFWSAPIIGFFVTIICYFAMTSIKTKFGYDDALDVFGCHGVGGLLGVLFVGIFADPSVNSALTMKGLVLGEYQLLISQISGIFITIMISVIMTFTIMLVLKKITVIRASSQEEKQGLDMSEHGEIAYNNELHQCQSDN